MQQRERLPNADERQRAAGREHESTPSTLARVHDGRRADATNSTLLASLPHVPPGGSCTKRQNRASASRERDPVEQGLRRAAVTSPTKRERQAPSREGRR